MQCVIMQPTYMPWAGYFHLISQADVFVFLDDVQFEKQSWQNRNRVLLNGAAHWLTVPVRRQHLSDMVHMIDIDESRPWRRKHYELLKTGYAKHPHCADMLELATPILDPAWTSLCDLNIALICGMAAKLGLERRFVRASSLGIQGQRSFRLLEICRHFGCDQYLSPRGASTYLMDDGAFSGGSVALAFQDFDAKPYPQRGSSAFVSHLSILDVVANLGLQGARHYVLG